MDRARVVLADDHVEFLAFTLRLIESEFEVLKTFRDGQSVVDEAEKLAPDLLVLDVTMPGLNGIETAQRLKAAGCKAGIIILTVHRDKDYVRSAMAAGALGYVVKDQLVFDLIPALREALAGRRFVSRSLLQPAAEVDGGCAYGNS